jgi:bifunctional lysine-specific demethylase and histidyl-hydroxylase MINA
MILQDAHILFQKILAPMPLDVFLDSVLGQRFIKIAGNAQSPRAHLFGEDPIQLTLQNFEVLAPRIGCHSEAPRGPHPTIEPVASAEAFKTKIEAFYDLGYTVRLRDIRRLSLALDEFLRAMESIFHVPVSVEAFQSRGDARAPVHHDDYDIIVIQLVGRKRWYISTEHSELPNVWKTIPESAPTLGPHEIVEVDVGDLLYLPRGTKHRVDALSDSFHLSIGFIPVTMREALIAAIDHLSEFDRTFRESVDSRLALSIRKNDFGALPERIREGIAKLHSVSRSDEFIAQALQRRSSRVIADLERLPAPKGGATLGPDTLLRHSPLALSHLMANAHKIDLSYPGGHLYIHRGVEGGVAFIAGTREFHIRDIPGEMSNEVRMALVQKFVNAGFLEVAS